MPPTATWIKSVPRPASWAVCSAVSPLVPKPALPGAVAPLAPATGPLSCVFLRGSQLCTAPAPHSGSDRDRSLLLLVAPPYLSLGPYCSPAFAGFAHAWVALPSRVEGSACCASMAPIAVSCSSPESSAVGLLDDVILLLPVRIALSVEGRPMHVLIQVTLGFCRLFARGTCRRP